jgi:hypothetical protein
LADRYWVSGTGEWNSTNTANWSTTSGGAGGASVPTSADDVFFDGNSDSGSAFTVTIGTGAVCKTFDANTGTPLDQTMTLAGTGALDIHGSFLLPSLNFTRTYTGTTTFRATTTGHTVTTNGVTFESRFAFDGVGGEWKLGSSLTITGSFFAPLLVSNGTFDTDGYGITLSNLSFSSPSIIYLRNSTVTLVGSAGSPSRGFLSVTDINGSNATLALTNGNCSVSYVGTLGTITHTATGTTYYDEIFVGTFDIVTRTSDGVSFIYFQGNPTITTELKVNSGNTNPVRRVFFGSGLAGGLTPGTQRTITAAAIDFGSGIDFQDIVAAGAASPFNVSALQGGDCKGNSNITFPAAKTVYRRGTGNFSDTQWAATSGGSPAADQFPLAQDTMVFDANTTTGTHTINAGYQLGTLTMTNSTTVTLASGTTTPVFYGDITLSNAVTPSGTGIVTLSGRTIQNITSAGKTLDCPLTVLSPNGSIVLQDNLTQGSTRTFTHTAGTVDLNGKTLTVGTNYSTSNSNVREIAFGSGGIIDCAGNFTATTGTNLTTSGTGTIKMSSGSAKTFAGGGRTYPVLEQAGAGTLTITGANKFYSIGNSYQPATIVFPANTTTKVTNFTVRGTPGNLMTLQSSSAGTRFTLEYEA